MTSSCHSHNRDEIFLKKQSSHIKDLFKEMGCVGIDMYSGKRKPASFPGVRWCSAVTSPPCVLVISGYHLSQHTEPVLFFWQRQASSGNFQPNFVFPYCLIKDTKKLFPTPPALMQGSKLNSAVRQIAGCGLGTGQ